MAAVVYPIIKGSSLGAFDLTQFPNRSVSKNIGLSSCSLESEILSPKSSSVYLTELWVYVIFIISQMTNMYSLLRSKTAEDKKTCRNTAYLSNLFKAEGEDYLEGKEVNNRKDVVNDY